MLKLVTQKTPPKFKESNQAIEDHNSLLTAYLRSHRIRNYTSDNIKRHQTFLKSWFEQHGPEHRPLFTWEAMEPIVGRKRIVDYGQALMDAGLRVDTIRSYLGMLRLYFAFVSEFPNVMREDGPVRIQEHYGTIEQPVTEFDMPPNNHDGQRLGVPLDPERLYEFYAILRGHYITRGWHRAIRSRNYAMAVLAGESGLRIDELLHLEMSRDLFFESGKLQTRYAKGKRGSGKRNRITVFTPLARDTVQFYLKDVRAKIVGNTSSDYLFASRSGKPLQYSIVHAALKEMTDCAKKEGFAIAPHMGWHWFRRIFATRFIERFPNQLSVLVNLLGHVSTNTVHCYIRHSEAWMDQKIQAVIEGTNKWPSVGD
ncbi:MAG: tyrosine-type recombinase/integrase [Bacteriovoracia bacterium]